MQRRRYLTLAGATSLSVLAGCASETEADSAGGDTAGSGTGGQNGTGSAGGDAATDSDGDSESASEPASVSSSVESQSFEGSGQTSTDPFDLTGDAAIFAFEHAGESNFAVKLLDGSGEMAELLANTIGEYQGRVVLGPPEGEYRFDIDADGDWTATVEPPTGEVVSLPQDASADAADFIGPVEFSGATTLTFEGTGDDNYGVWLRDATGQNVDLLVNEIGPTDELSTTFSGDGVGFVQVETAGAWSATLESS